LFIANAYYWNKLKTNGSVNVSASQANMMFWLNIIWIFVASAILIWAIIRMFIKPKPNTLELAKGMTNAPPVVVYPTENSAPQLGQQIGQQFVPQYVTSVGQPGNIVTSQGEQVIRNESMYV